MKRSVLAVLFAVCLMFASVAFAADYSGTADQSGAARGDQAQTSQMDATRGAQAGAANIIKADDLKGKKIQDAAGNEIGKVKSVALNTTTGSAYALVEMDNKLHPVPVSAIKKMQDKYTLNIDKSRLAQSPSVTEDNMAQQLASSDFDTQVHRFFGIAPPMSPTAR
ncbi:MAG: PRC-barrel domain-containing protein [Nitrospirota bacterium]